MDGLCEACNQGDHIACDGAGLCACDLCVPYELRLVNRPPPSGKLTAFVILAAFAICLALMLFGGFAHAQTANAVIVNRKGTSGASIAITAGAAVELLTGNTLRYQYCTVCTVPVNCTWTDPLTPAPSTTDPTTAVAPTSSVGYPLAASTNYCEDARTFGITSVRSRMDCISTNGSGSCATREEQ